MLKERDERGGYIVPVYASNDQRLTDMAHQIRRSAVYEDRLEYDAEDLSKAYGLRLEDASILRTELHRLAGETP